MLEVIHIYKLGRIFKNFPFMANFFFKLNRFINGCHIHPECKLGQGIVFVHGGIGIVINRRVSFGKNIRIYQNVTIGNDGTKGGIPKIADNVTIYANCVIVGNIIIGEGATIGACSFVNKDIPPHSTWAGVPAKDIGSK